MPRARRGRRCKMLFITGYAENAVIGNGQLEPGMQVLTKPFEMAELVRRAGAIIAEESRADASPAA